MTCREKLRLEHPDHADKPHCVGGCSGCPKDYGYLNYPDEYSYPSYCTECWDREIPGTEPLTYEHTGEPIGKVTDITEDENGVTATIKKEKTMATKKTKADLEKELEAIKESKAELEKELKNLEKYKQYEEMADELKAMHTAFMNAGFSNTQAYDMVKTMTIGMMPAVLKNLTRN